MTPECKERFRFVEDTVDGVLRPLGFTKKKANWRRTIKEVLQQFSIVSMQLNGQFRPYWGLNILSRCEDPAPLPWKLSVQWILGMHVKNTKETVAYLDCFDFSVDAPLGLRRRLIEQFLKKHVIPCFEAFTTEQSVRRMMGDRAYPLRAHSFVRLPDEWWPGGRRAVASDRPDPPDE
jgi:hypothetical protein